MLPHASPLVGATRPARHTSLRDSTEPARPRREEGAPQGALLHELLLVVTSPSGGVALELEARQRGGAWRLGGDDMEPAEGSTRAGVVPGDLQRGVDGRALARQ